MQQGMYLYRLVNKGESDAWNHSDCNLGIGVGGRASTVAAQQRVGLLPDRRRGRDSAHCHCSSGARPDLIDRLRVAAGGKVDEVSTRSDSSVCLVQ